MDKTMEVTFDKPCSRDKGFLDATSQYNNLGERSVLESLKDYLEEKDADKKYQLYLAELGPLFGVNVEGLNITPIVSYPKALSNFFSSAQNELKHLLELAKTDKSSSNTDSKLAYAIWSACLEVCETGEDNYIDKYKTPVVKYNNISAMGLSEKAMEVFYWYELNFMEYASGKSDIIARIRKDGGLQLHMFGIFQDYKISGCKIPFPKYVELKELHYFGKIREELAVAKKNAQQTFREELKLVEVEYETASSSLDLMAAPMDLETGRTVKSILPST